MIILRRIGDFRSSIFATKQRQTYHKRQRAGSNEDIPGIQSSEAPEINNSHTHVCADLQVSLFNITSCIGDFASFTYRYNLPESNTGGFLRKIGEDSVNQSPLRYIVQCNSRNSNNNKCRFSLDFLAMKS